MKKRTKNHVYPKKDILFLLPSLLGFALFYVLPFLISPYYSVIQSNFDPVFVGLRNYQEVWGNKYYQLALQNTFTFSFIAAPLSTVFAFFLCLNIRKRKAFLAFQTIFILPILLPSASISNFMLTLFSEKNSYWSFLPFALSKQTYIQLSLYAFFMFKYVGINVIILMSGFCMIEKEVEEAALLDGVNGFKKGVHILIPMMVPSLFFTFVYSLINSFKIFKECYTMYGAYPELTAYQLQHYLNNHFNKLNYQNLSAGALMFSGAVIVIVLVILQIEKSITKEVF